MESEVQFEIHTRFRKKDLMTLPADCWILSNTFLFDMTGSLVPTVQAQIPSSKAHRETLWQQVRDDVSSRMVRVFRDQDSLLVYLAFLASITKGSGTGMVSA